MITFKTRNLKRLCMTAGIIGLLVSGGANAHVLAGGYEPDSCTPHGGIFDLNAGCRGTFSDCNCTYVPEGGTTPVDCRGVAENATAPPGIYHYYRLTTCGLGLGPTWDSPPYSPPFTFESDKPSCGHVFVTVPGTNAHSDIVPDVDWTHDCALLGTALVTKTQAMDGDLKVAQGSTLFAGFDFTMPGTHPDAMIGFLGAKVVFNATCASGSPGSKMIVVDIPNQIYTVPANNSAWYPSGDQTSAATYQGSATVPSFCDPAALVRLQQGGKFSANVLSTDKQNKVNVRWHYSDGTGGGWSGTYSVIGN